MTALARIQVNLDQAGSGSRRASADLSPAMGNASSTVFLTAWTRDEVVGAELFRAPAYTTSATWARIGETQDGDEHLFADADEIEPSWLWAADVIVHKSGEGTAERQLSSIFRCFPGCLIAGILGPGDVCAVASRNGWSTKVVGRSARGTGTRVLGWYASFAHAWMTSGRSLSALADAFVTVSVESSGRGERESYGRVVSVIGSNA
jgi:hypothetical protein